MPNVWCVRADFGRYAQDFLSGKYVAIGWNELGDLTAVSSREELATFYRSVYPDESKLVSGQQIGQVSRFRFEMLPGDWVITPAADTEFLNCAQLVETSNYYFAGNADSCPYQHRRNVVWFETPVARSSLSVPLQNTIRSSLTVFAISQTEEFLSLVGSAGSVAEKPPSNDPYIYVIDRILELDAKEFEILVGHVLTAIGFEGSEVVGGVGDGGVDATGEINVANLVKVKIYVQAKRYSRGQMVSASTVRQLRQAIPFGGQGGFVTTADFQKKALDIAVESGFPRIGLINGHQLVDLLVEHWNEIPADFREKLGLKPGLVRAS